MIDTHNLSNRGKGEPFINIPGNVDIAVKGSILYADLFHRPCSNKYFSHPTQVSLTKIIPSVFPERQYGNGFIADTSKIIVDWIEKKSDRQTGCTS